MNKPNYNSKRFLLPTSPRSMACYHAKVMQDGIMKLTIHDCKTSIQLHNDLNDPEQVQEAIEKLESLAKGIYNLQFFIARNYLQYDRANKTEEGRTTNKTNVPEYIIGTP